MGEQVVYVYGIASAGLDATGAPSGLDDAPVSAERAGRLTALVSHLDAATYAGGTAEARAGDLDWIGPRALAHDAVLTWASDAGGVIPLPMFTLFSDVDAVRAMLHDRHDTLTAVLERVADAREYSLRIFRLDAALVEALPTLSARVSELQQQAASATPGQRYLLERKLDAERRTEVKRLGREIATDAFDTLAPLAVDAVREPLPAPPADGTDAGEAVLNASFLVRREATGDFQAAVAALARRHDAAGMRFEFTGPWPAYHFVREGR